MSTDMSIEEKQGRKVKGEAVDRLIAIDVASYHLDTIDPRLVEYIEAVKAHPDGHNLYEILAIVRFFSLVEKYELRPSRAKRFIRLYEALKFSGIKGRRRYKMTPIQVFQFVSIKGLYSYIDNEGSTISKDRIIDNGKEHYITEDEARVRRRYTYIDDEGCERGVRMVRLVRRAILYVPRKYSKTTSAASLAVDELLNGDSNGQAYTAALSYTQAQICFKEIYKIVQQLDPQKKYFKKTREHIEWRPNRFGKESTVDCLTGGNDTKDGLAASIVIFDEYAAAKYVRGHSDGAELLQVLESSMGTRLEPLVVIITTASRNPNTPFMVELENAKSVLRGDYEADTLFASLFMPDEWECNDQWIGEESVWRKCNPHIGVTVQPSFYRQAYNDALHDSEKMLEFKSKLLNIFVSGQSRVWLSGELIRSLSFATPIHSLPRRYQAMVGVDLSVSDDFSAVTYMLYQSDEQKFYSWTSYYIPRVTLETHQNSGLYKRWVEAGYMNVCDGEIIDYRMIADDILHNDQYIEILQIGYDSYKSQEMINYLRSAIMVNGADPNKCLRPVPQTYGAFTSPVESMEIAAKNTRPGIGFELNPITIFCFENAYLDEDSLGNKKPIKAERTRKIDGVISNLECLWLFNNYV